MMKDPRQTAGSVLSRHPKRSSFLSQERLHNFPLTTTLGRKKQELDTTFACGWKRKSFLKNFALRNLLHLQS